MTLARKASTYSESLCNIFRADGYQRPAAQDCLGQSAMMIRTVTCRTYIHWVSDIGWGMFISDSAYAGNWNETQQILEAKRYIYITQVAPGLPQHSLFISVETILLLCLILPPRGNCGYNAGRSNVLSLCSLWPMIYNFSLLAWLINKVSKELCQKVGN